MGDLLKSEGLVKSRRRKRWAPGATPAGMQEAKGAVDFKGDFLVDHERCYPLTTTDVFSRFLLGCQALKSTASVGARPVFERCSKLG